MSNSSNSFSDESIYHDLSVLDPASFEAVYAECRRLVARAVNLAGGSMSDGFTFFRVALIHTAFLATENRLDTSIPISTFLESLATAHFKDWAKEKQIELHVETEEPENPALPDDASRSAFREQVRARRQWAGMESPCKKTLLELAKDASINVAPKVNKDSAAANCLEQYRKLLNSEDPAWSEGLPSWAVVALTDKPFQKAWSIAENIEGRISMGLSPTPEPESKSNRYVLILLGVILLGYAAWWFFDPSLSPGEVYNKNFEPPTSILADRDARLVRDSLDDNVPPACLEMLQEADRHYKQKDYYEAANVLYPVADEEESACQSEALFYLAIIALQLEDPGATIDCLARISDIESFGEDIYWYQALAFVKIAAINPLRKDIARRAVERARSNTELPERRAQAEKMLEQLSN
ncbi:MAG: hypothetical protein H6576_05075 [Lewinellaceae bacterium]|nr:hypothetical protein [Saprospiraceae bacterium]MCB9343042.1 hypothetical protein [Lewinellaceae bacterium]